MSGKPYDESQLRKYPIKLSSIPKLMFDDPQVDSYIASNEPVVIRGCDLVASANSWDIDYLNSNLTGKCTVILSNNHKFKYYDEKKIHGCPNFTPNTKRVQMKFSEFSQRISNWKNNEERLYLQQVLNNTVGMTIVQDFAHFNWNWIKEKQTKNSWGPLSSNLLLVSMEGNVTPCHYDEQQNFYAQVKGYKRIIMFRPSQFRCLYPHPVHHPYDRQSQVDFEKPDYACFPNFKDVEGIETVIEPGEVLYIPIYWFHHVESLLKGGYTVSINFWYKSRPTAQVIYPLKDHQKVAIMRNVEKMLGDALRDPAEIGSLLHTIIEGRYVY